MPRTKGTIKNFDLSELLIAGLIQVNADAITNISDIEKIASRNILTVKRRLKESKLELVQVWGVRKID